ncbi:hypothetical protein AX774_g6286 [Zancudomyces culisetae]|uniref:Uncharacterized protein n=1 Tax=Zancudomyces culisetae TaxID=1213189 RepID=A0A1R1PH07_ZANCU|nr:hypothetical protein AX774_g6286 [Zancudomyces culisetae]|eukprot:OMH80285.1 hypothetical protein AX774_g6286 [Zancudomyces culisetae]
MIQGQSKRGRTERRMSMVSSDTTVTEQDHKHRPECGTEQRFRSAVEPDFENETMIGKEVGKEVGTKTEAMGNTENNTRVQDTTNRNSKNSDIFDSPSGDNSGGIDDTLMVEGGDNDNHEYNVNTDKYHLLDLTTEIDPLINKGGIKMNRFPTPTSGAAFIKYYNEYLDKQENNLEVDGKKQNRDYWLGEFPETPEFMKPRSNQEQTE